MSSSNLTTDMMDVIDMTDIELNTIAEEIGLDIGRLGLRLGYTWRQVQFYQLRNCLTWSSSGTMEMLHSWGEKCSARNKRKALARTLAQADLVELAERVKEGKFIQAVSEMHNLVPGKFVSIKRTLLLAFLCLFSVLLAIAWRVFCFNLLFLPAEIRELREHLIHYYDSSVCDTEALPWTPDSILELDDLFVNLHPLHRNVDQGSKLEQRPVFRKELFDLNKKKGRLARRVVLKGAAGTRRKTLTCKIAHDWTRCRSRVWGFYIRCTPLVIILQQRLIDPKNSLGQEVLNQALVPRDRHGTITADLIDNFISQNPESVVIIFNGSEAYVDGSLKDETKEGILDISRYKSFRGTMLMITYRHRKPGNRGDIFPPNHPRRREKPIFDHPMGQGFDHQGHGIPPSRPRPRPRPRHK